MQYHLQFDRSFSKTCGLNLFGKEDQTVHGLLLTAGGIKLEVSGKENRL
jgi:hypothetical protein